ncbi:hypothetical protein pb186bvf_004373 [Paramecium bursaria]
MKRVGEFQVHINTLLGKGSFGMVYLGNNSITGDICAVKCIQTRDIKKEELEKVQAEIGIMKQVKHENVVQLITFLQTPNNYYLILEYCNDGTLDQFIKKKNQSNQIKFLPESEAYIIFDQLLEGLQALYDKKVIHRDIKPQNILIHQGQVKLGDLGFAKIIECEMEMIKNQTYAGSPLYMSPSLGIVFYEILYGVQPFQAKSIPELIQFIEKRQIIFPQKPYVSLITKDLITQMLQVDEAKRISMEQLYKFKIDRITQETQQLTPKDKPIIPMRYQSEIKQNDSINSYQTTVTSNKGKTGIFEVVQPQLTPKQSEDRFNKQVYFLKNNDKIQKVHDWILRKKNKVVLLNNLNIIFYGLDEKMIFKDIPSIYFKLFMFAFSQYYQNINVQVIKCLETKTISLNKKITQDMLDIYLQKQGDDHFLQSFQKQYILVDQFYQSLCAQLEFIKHKQFDDQRIQNIIKILVQKPDNKSLKQVLVTISDYFIEKAKGYINQFGLNSYKDIFQLIYYLDMIRKNRGQILKQDIYLDFQKQEYISKYESEEYVLKLYSLK